MSHHFSQPVHLNTIFGSIRVHYSRHKYIKEVAGSICSKSDILHLVYSLTITFVITHGRKICLNQSNSLFETANISEQNSETEFITEREREKEVVVPSNYWTICNTLV